VADLLFFIVNVPEAMASRFLLNKYPSNGDCAYIEDVPANSVASNVYCFSIFIVLSISY